MTVELRDRFATRARAAIVPTLLTLTVGALATGIVAVLLGEDGVADIAWATGTVVALIPAVGWVVAAVRRRSVGVDLIAVLSLIGTLAVHEYLAGALIAVMLATGRTLDAAAERRASRDLRALLERAPRTAHRMVGDAVTTVPLESIVAGDRLMVKPGEVVPVDGWVESGTAVLDESALTGEPLQVERPAGERVRSGVVNAGGPLQLRCEAAAEASTYAGIVRLARDAAADTAPVVRLADRFAAWFLPLTLAVAGAAWAFSGSAVRAVSVLVVATPCPLLLAAPVAIVSGLSRASRLGVVVRSGGALESLGRARTLVLDKTGTLTTGTPAGLDVATAPNRSSDEVLRLAAAADQFSPHVVAQAIVHSARVRRLELPLPTDVDEQAGTGVAATVEGRRVRVGDHAVPDTLPQWATTVRTRSELDGTAIAWVWVDAELAGAITIRDPLRRDAPRTLRRLRASGLTRLIMLTGDRPAPAREIATVVGLDAVFAEQTPADKVAVVRDECRLAVTVMVGDGVNDAPALATATVGVAMGARGATASSEAADVVLTTDRLDRLADAIEIAHRSRAIAIQSAGVGMALSLIAMTAAAFGFLPPAVGALLQEGIDVAVILNALRALRMPPSADMALDADTERLVRRFDREHDELRTALPMIREAAEQLATEPSDAALAALRRAHRSLTERLLPHERSEERELYPAIGAALGSTEVTATMSRAHAEIERLARRLAVHVEMADAHGGIRPDQIDDLRACLYGLYAVLQLHFAQEEEGYFVMSSDRGT
ncbi:heavy metal translocating P-type ATPase [Rhodococcus sp. ABRD24]|uniref:heavy metal translocating P-type ATPase n=1 Tax=Rhodococcus sp. ABRD24 TaxID=2507582 RepID=UPI00103A6A7F|nr:heavy metal translocating P-type ATPase [Rhodococcus sp. ABRD24]QBJ94617.1 heavy metal translocating P-type ATPase [Rhodococcus sp. ABRD24]